MLALVVRQGAFFLGESLPRVGNLDMASKTMEMETKTLSRENGNKGEKANDTTAVLLLLLLVVVVGILAYALRKCLYTVFPPGRLPCVVSTSPPRGWRGQRLGVEEDEDEEEEGEHGGGGCYSRWVRLPSARHDDQEGGSHRGRKRHKPPALELLKARILRGKPRAGARTDAGDGPERDLEAAFHLLPPSPGAARDSPGEGRERDPFDWSPSLTPSPRPPTVRPTWPVAGGDDERAREGGVASFWARRADRGTGRDRGFWGGKDDEEGYELESPLGLSRYFEDEGVGIRDM